MQTRARRKHQFPCFTASDEGTLFWFFVVLHKDKNRWRICWRLGGLLMGI